jgi:hypothetical protein
MNKSELLSAILKLPVNEARALLREAHQCLEVKARNQFDPGQKVRFRTKHGATIEGTVTRVNRKNIIVHAKKDRYGMETPRPVQWTVSPSLLEAVE